MAPLRGKSVFDAFIRELDGDRPAPIYVFAGNELYLIRQATDLLVERLLPEEAREFDLDRVSVRNWDTKRIITAVLTYPMMAKRRVVVVEDAEDLPAASVEIWKRYVERPSPTGCIIFQARGVPLMGRGDKRFQVFLKSSVAHCYEFTPFYDSEAVRWVNEQIVSRGKAIQPQAAQLLVDEVGSDLSALANEIDKLLLALREGEKEIDPQLVRRVVVGARGYTVYDLQEAIVQSDLSQALAIVHRLLELGASETTIVFQLAAFYRQVALMAQAMRRGLSDKEALTMLGLREGQRFVLRKLRRYVPHVASGEERLGRAFDALQKAELALKSWSGRREGRRILDLLVYCLVKDVPADMLVVPEVFG